MGKPVAELIGADLSLCVAKIIGRKYCFISPMLDKVFDSETEEVFSPDEDWAHGGPLIERHYIAIAKGMNQITFPGWHAKVGLVATYDTLTGRQFGPTPLIAAMRALVWSVYGDTVPDEVINE